MYLNETQMYKKQTNAHNNYLCFMIQEEIGQLADWLATPANMVIIPHKNPDGDAMGSCLGWQHILLQLGHEAVVIAPNEYPSYTKFVQYRFHNWRIGSCRGQHKLSSIQRSACDIV